MKARLIRVTAIGGLPGIAMPVYVIEHQPWVSTHGPG
jgi:hypothetical protein